MKAPFISVGLSNRYQKVPLALGKIPGEEDRDFQAWSPSTGWGTGTIPGLQSVLIKVFPVVWKIKKNGAQTILPNQITRSRNNDLVAWA